MDIQELSLRDLTIKSVSHYGAHKARALANQDRDFGWHIATLPDVIRWRLDQSDSMGNGEKINTGWCLTDTEEFIVSTPEDRHEILVIHGGALFTKPSEVFQLEQSSWDRGLDIDLADSYYLRAGINAGMKSLDMFSYDLFLKLDDLPKRYGGRIDQDLLLGHAQGWHLIDSFRHNPLLIARCGGVELTHSYLDALKREGDWNTQVEHEFDHRGITPFGYIVQTLGFANISPFFNDLTLAMKPQYLLAREKKFEERGATYREAPKRM